MALYGLILAFTRQVLARYPAAAPFVGNAPGNPDVPQSGDTHPDLFGGELLVDCRQRGVEKVRAVIPFNGRLFESHPIDVIFPHRPSASFLTITRSPPMANPLANISLHRCGTLSQRFFRLSNSEQNPLASSRPMIIAGQEPQNGGNSKNLMPLIVIMPAPPLRYV